LRAIRAFVRAPRRVWNKGLPAPEKLGLLVMLLKGFYAPLMALLLFPLAVDMVTNGRYLITYASDIPSDLRGAFDAFGYWFLFQLLFFIDVTLFTVGYLVEHPRLNNEIRSVDPTWLGWTVALACYTPFNAMVGTIMGWGPEDFPQFEAPVVHFAVNGLILVLLAIYASASVALNLKASNLTHRGIVSRGPYRFVRHPAYVAKNLGWWLGTIPALGAAWASSAWDAFMLFAQAAAWTGVYVLRALTEEDHLRSVDGEYDAYCQKVSYRFIPGIY
jgi:protein-S-isoprenylcysteine O-methyltransferase Ste14